MRAKQNKAAYAHAHGMGLTWSSALLDREYDGTWNKLVLLRTLMRVALGGNQTGGGPGGSGSGSGPGDSGLGGGGPGGGGSGGGGERTRWLLWADWDVLFTDLTFELPIDEYEVRGLGAWVAALSPGSAVSAGRGKGQL